MPRLTALAATIALALLASACASQQAYPPTTSTEAITLEVYADFRCPHCARFSASYTPRILRHFRRDVEAGRLLYRHRNLPVLGPRSEFLALHSECARDQGRFDAFHDALYRQQYQALNDVRIPFVDGPGAALEAVDSSAGVTPGPLAYCMDSDLPHHAVQADIDRARDKGITATPTLVLNGIVLEWDGYDSIISQVQAALERPPP